MIKPLRFMIRAYGLLVSPDKHVLISHEKIKGMKAIKFPGGGVELGEGPANCLKREFREETGLEVTLERQLYTADFLIQNQFNPEEQVIGIYFILRLSTSTAERPVPQTEENNITHEWIPVNMLEPELMTFEMDKAAVRAYNNDPTR